MSTSFFDFYNRQFLFHLLTEIVSICYIIDYIFIFWKKDSVLNICHKLKERRFWFENESKVIAKRRKGIRDPASRISREDFFSISLFPWGKGNFFGEFPFLHVGREEIFLNFPSHMKKNQKKMNFYLLKWAKSVIFCEKKRDSFPTFYCGKKKFQFPFSHGGREIFLRDFPFRMWEGKRLSSHFPSQRSLWMNRIDILIIDWVSKISNNSSILSNMRLLSCFVRCLCENIQ